MVVIPFDTKNLTNKQLSTFCKQHKIESKELSKSDMESEVCKFFKKQAEKVDKCSNSCSHTILSKRHEYHLEVKIDQSTLKQIPQMKEETQIYSKEFPCFGHDWEFELKVIGNDNENEEYKRDVCYYLECEDDNVMADTSMKLTCTKQEEVNTYDDLGLSFECRGWSNGWGKCVLDHHELSNYGYEEVCLQLTLNIYNFHQIENPEYQVIPKREILKRLRDQESDFMITAGDTEIPVHRCFLKIASPVFAAMMEHDCEENVDGKMNLDTTPEIANVIVDYLYTGQYSIPDTIQVDKLLEIAHKYQLNELVSELLQHITHKISEQNAVQLLTVAHVLSNHAMVDKVFDFIQQNPKVEQQREFQDLLERNPALSVKLLKLSLAYSRGKKRKFAEV